ncbi:hypothetical protein N7508_011061 [Penicillium antarcticum]|uniref:uncharacterized protein n=1 Tax=Penicillium antarcticum TaxID=416450 RepID=UPI0023949DF3|nr:uncharacterized protein N7508_011061 [Penicillium antarcticum]KAJ5288286.1 hypothetical protein N7508_011061 [Penicillium antarcticum]
MENRPGLDPSSIAPWSWTLSMSPGADARSYPTPNSLSPSFQTPTAPAQSYSQPYPSATSSSSSAPGSAFGSAQKVAIPRLAGSEAGFGGRRRSARACEPCRQRKIKCDGQRPSCRQCVYYSQLCSYEDVKRVRDQKRLGTLAKRVDAYEALLRELEGEVDLPTARQIRKALQTKDFKSSQRNGDTSDDSSASLGSLDGIDEVDEDLNRDDSSRAAGFFGKNSEVNWICKLASGLRVTSPSGNATKSTLNSSHPDSHQDASVQQRQSPGSVLSTSIMDYHLNNLEIPFIESCDPFAFPPQELADRYFDTYMTYVHPTFAVIRKETFISQYQKFFENMSVTRQSRKWLAILNMMFAIGYRHCRLMDNDHRMSEEDLVFLSRARLLGFDFGVLFEHSDLQQIQLESLMAIYLLCLGQVNRASKFSSMALRSALSLGINLRLTENQISEASKEARVRLWWSIYSLEHLVTSVTGRPSGVTESICAIPLPFPCAEETFDQPEAKRLFQNSSLRETHLRPTLFEAPSRQRSQAWSTACPPCPSLFFHHLVDLTLITQALMTKVYSVEGLRQGPSRIEYHVNKFGLKLDRWLAKLSPCYQFTLPDAGPWHLNHPQLDDLGAPFVRERVCLAMNYYSARITLCRPCLTHIDTNTQPSRDSPGSSPDPDKTSCTKLRNEMATHCLQAACALIAILPESPSFPWLARTSPWWSVLHFIMQATTALLLGLSYRPYNTKPESQSQFKSSDPLTLNTPNSSAPSLGAAYSPLPESDLGTAIATARKAMRWIHATSQVDMASRRAFLLCENVIKRIAPGLGIDLRDWPDGSEFVGDLKEMRSQKFSGNANGAGNWSDGDGNERRNEIYNESDCGSGMELFEEFIDFEGVCFIGVFLGSHV